METACYQYDLGVELDFKKLEKVGVLSRVGKLDVMQASFGEVSVQLFKAGEMRAFSPGRDIKELQQALLSVGMKIAELLQEIKAAGHAVDGEKVISGGHPMPFEYLAPDGVRPSFKGVGVNMLREVAYAPFDLSQQFQLERNAVQAGESAGRRLVASGSPKDVKAVNSLLAKFLESEGIGAPKFSEEREERSTYPAQVLELQESAFAVGMPVINKPYCHFIRGLLRGAYVAFYELENIAVGEHKCWGLGDTFCAFRAVVHPK